MKTRKIVVYVIWAIFCNMAIKKLGWNCSLETLSKCTVSHAKWEPDISVLYLAEMFPAFAQQKTLHSGPLFANGITSRYVHLLTNMMITCVSGSLSVL